MGALEERRDVGDFTLRAPVRATVTCVVGGEEVELDADVVRASARTVVVELGSGLSTLAVASSPTCELVLRSGGVTIRTDAQPGRRIADVPHAHQLELVITDDTLDLAQLL